MSTRTRYILHHPNYGNMRGVKAIYTVIGEAARHHNLNMEYPADWKSRKTAEKIQYMMKFVPPEWVLQIFREPKGTRKNRSAFMVAINKKPAKSLKDIATKLAVQAHWVVPEGIVGGRF